jgi:hypothetical protein
MEYERREGLLNTMYLLFSFGKDLNTSYMLLSEWFMLTELMKYNVHNRDDATSPFDPKRSKLNSVHIFATNSSKMDFNIFLPYGLDDLGSGVRFPAGAGNFSLHHRVQNGSGAHPASYPMGTRGSFPGGKAARA